MEQPQIVIRSPDEGETLSQGVDINFEADVFDSNDAPNELQVVFESSVDESFVFLPYKRKPMSWRANREACQVQLSAEYHQLTYTVTDLMDDIVCKSICFG